MQHRELERQLVRLFHLAVVVEFARDELVGLDLVDLGVDDPFDVALPHLGFEHALGVADAADAEMADIGLRRHEGHRHLVADAPLAQVGVHDHGELVGRAEAGRALHRADHDRAGILAEFLPAIVGRRRVIDVADRIGVAFGPEPLDLVEGEFRTGRDDQIIVIERSAVAEFDPILGRVHALGAGAVEFDAVLRQHGREVDDDVVLGPPIHRHPGVRRGELKERLVGNERDPVFPPQRFFQLIGARHAADAAAEHDDVSHEFPPDPNVRL